MIHVKETQQLLQTIAVFSQKCVSVGMFVRVNTCHLSPINFSRAFTACLQGAEVVTAGKTAKHLTGLWALLVLSSLSTISFCLQIDYLGQRKSGL